VKIGAPTLKIKGWHAVSIDFEAKKGNFGGGLSEEFGHRLLEKRKKGLPLRSAG
jgi:hypothetical protein